MKHWIRVPVARHCGGCCKVIPKDDPELGDDGRALVITSEVGSTFLRCQACALRVHGEAPPAVIEVLPTLPPKLPPFGHNRPQRDAKQRQTGESD